MRFKTMPGRLVDPHPENMYDFTHDVWMLQEGDFSWTVSDNGERTLHYVPPGLDHPFSAPVTTDQSQQDKSGKNGHYWWWNGDTEKPTLQPSIGIYGTKGELPWRWHGFLVDGVWKACE